MTSPLLNRVTPKDTIETWRQKTNEIVDRLKDLYPHVTNNLNVENDALIGGKLTVDGQLHVKEDLIVDGTVTTINSTELHIEDSTILLNSNLTGTPPNVLQSGIEVNRGSSDNKKIYWDEATDKWNIEGPLNIEGNLNDISGHYFQWGLDSNTNHIYNLNTGNVGIGTTSPQTKLHLNHGETSVNGPQELLRLQGDWNGATGVDGDGALIRFTNQHNSATNPNTGEYNVAGIAGLDDSSNWGGSLHFQTSPTGGNGGNNLQTRMVVKYDGKVGIGTTDPDCHLHTYSSSNSTINMIKASNHLGVAVGLIAYQNSHAEIRVGTDHDLLFKTNDNNERMRITNDGNVGINTTSPLRKLHVRYEQDLPQPASSAISTSTSAVISGRDGGLELLSTDDDTSVANFIGLGRYSQTDGSLIHKFGIVHRVNTGSQGTNSGKSLGFTYGGSANSYGNNELLTILAGGSVGIGNTNPGARLSVTRSNKSIELDFISPWNRILSFDRITNAEVPLKVRGLKFTIDTNNTEQFRINDDGNVSIGGNATPAEKLEVDGAVKLGTTSNNNVGTIRYNTTTNDFEGNTDGTSGGWTSLTNANANLWSAGTSSGDIHYSSGNVGIGTNDPSAKLEIAGDKDATNLIVGAPLHTVNGGGLADYSEILFDNNYVTGSSGTAYIRHYANSHQNSEGALYFGTTSSTGTTSSALAIRGDGETISYNDIKISKSFPKLIIDSPSTSTGGDEWTNEGAMIVLGESADTEANAALYLTYNGNGNSYIGTGGVNSTTGVPSQGYIHFPYNSNSVNIPSARVGIGTSASTSTTNYKLNMGGHINMNNNDIAYVNVLHFGNNVRFYDDAFNDQYLNYKWGDTEGGGIRFLDGNNTIHGYIYGDGSGAFGLLSSSFEWGVRLLGNGETQLYYDDSEKLNTKSTGVDITGDLEVSGSISAVGDIESTSDIRIKENLEIIENPIDKIKELNGYTFNKNGEEKRSAGLIAQEVEKVLPEVVSENSDGIKSLAYGNIVALLVETVKEQQKQIDELKKLISDK